MNLDKTKIQAGVSNHSKLDVSSTHITSAGFMQLAPVYYRHMIPGEHIKGRANVLSRLAPVAVPTYGRCRINMRSFFVPFRTVFPNFNEFIVDTIGSNYSSSSLIADSPYINNEDFMDCFQLTDMADIISGWTAGDPFDFAIGGNHYELTALGRWSMKVLQSLGYRVTWGDKSNIKFSALGLLSFAKVYYDWYSNAAYMDSASYLALQRIFKFNDPTSAFHLTGTDLFWILKYVRFVIYDSGRDVFVNAWDNPVAPNSGLYSTSLSANDITAYTQVGSVSLDGYGTPTMYQSANSDTSIGTLYIHQMLRAMTDYIKRNQLAGSRQVDRFLARYGINLDSAKVDRSIYISSQSVDIDFGSVMQHTNTAAPTDPSNLGDYAGQGKGDGKFGFDFKADEFGLFIVCASIVPNGSLYQGFDRNNLHLRKDEFFNPEFDNLGVQAIAKGEVYVSNDGTYGASGSYANVFGYAPRLYEYKQKQDYVTGDIISPTRMDGGDAWHLMRKLTDDSFGSLVAQTHSLTFTRGIDGYTYNRIFQYTGDLSAEGADDQMDTFYLVYHFAAESLAPCKSLFDTYDFEDAGKSLTMTSNGSKVN